MGIHEIEEAIRQLPPDELARFRQWYAEFDAQIWDEQFERDAKAGKLNKLAEKAIEEYRAGKSKEL
jgi:hypothetical protein